VLSEQQVRQILSKVEDPELHRPITDLDMVRGVVVDEDRVRVSIALTVPGCPLKATIHADVTDVLRAAGVNEVGVDFTTMSEDERAALQERLHPFPEMRDVFARSRVLAVASGKGGVGKSSISANLAIALAARGFSAALIDADVYGFSIPRMFDLDRRPVIIDRMIVPPQAHGVSVMSIGFFAGENDPVIWRGPMLHKALTQFLTDVFWDSPQVVVVDMPPGTGDVALTMAQFLPATEVVVVTTPQPAAQRVAQRTAFMARKVHLGITGVIENMSWFTGRDGVRYELFGSGGGELLAQELGVPLLGRIPLVPALREGGDAGMPILASDPGSEVGRSIDEIAGRILELGPPPGRRVELPIIGVTSGTS
jgi:ATP-binding protein involved in chromosome partitioning